MGMWADGLCMSGWIERMEKWIYKQRDGQRGAQAYRLNFPTREGLADILGMSYPFCVEQVLVVAGHSY